ncbi:hypothetical protein DL95DRAFT_383662 [Leptodontidium sp. 2 PMI_412]|nr:hypothetical protein DL95DRAFT_383662 [Leptodontidium sp. 2 PMI_412]
MPSSLQVLAGPVLAAIATGVWWLLIIRTDFPRISTPPPARSGTYLCGGLSDQWTYFLEHAENIRFLIRKLIHPHGSINFNSIISILHDQSQVRENIALAILATICYGTAITLILKHHDDISRAWGLRLVVGVVISSNLHLLGKIVWNQYAPVWLFVVNSCLQTLNWDWWTETGKEVREGFWTARLRSVGFEFARLDDGKGQEQKTEDATRVLKEH